MPKYQCAVLVLLLAAGVGGAAEDRGFYLGAGIGRAIGDQDGDSEAGSGSRGTEVIEQKSSTWSAFGGYRFFRSLASLEAGYADLGRSTYPGIAGCAYARENSISSYYLRANGRLPIFSALSLTAHAGAARASYDLRTRQSTNLVPGLFCVTLVRDFPTPASETALLWGAGIEWDFTERFRLRGEWSRHELNHEGMGSGSHELAAYSAALVYKF